MLSQLFDRNKTFKPKKKLEPSNPRYELHKLAQETLAATLGTGNLRESVKVPDGYDANDWISVTLLDLFNQVSLIYGSLCEGCTDKSCPSMTAGPKYEYLWQDTDKYKTPTKLPAPKYIDVMMDWADKQLSDEAIFPVVPGSKFPSNFLVVVKSITRRLFRVYAHVYHHHLDEIMAVGAEAHLNTCFRHFMYFSQEFGMLPVKETEPLKEIIAKI
mmetsp:Transcript_8586/g.21359  ORF Transcript_8586/g.21359 Transcript_8586/m.21359 type:complete len:215 (-) Transcript_8586:174-818(-)